MRFEGQQASSRAFSKIILLKSAIYAAGLPAGLLLALHEGQHQEGLRSKNKSKSS